MKHPVLWDSRFAGLSPLDRSSPVALLGRHGVDYDSLYMRTTGDKRSDRVVKQELFDQFIRDTYRVEFVLDDRNSVVELWRSMGLICLQVADGDF